VITLAYQSVVEAVPRVVQALADVANAAGTTLTQVAGDIKQTAATMWDSMVGGSSGLSMDALSIPWKTLWDDIFSSPVPAPPRPAKPAVQEEGAQPNPSDDQAATTSDIGVASAVWIADPVERPGAPAADCPLSAVAEPLPIEEPLYRCLALAAVAGLGLGKSEDDRNAMLR
jgi:hypothetical protein